MISTEPKLGMVDDKIGVKNHTSLEQVFQHIIGKGKEVLMESGSMSPCVFLIFRDHEASEFKLGLYPIINKEDGDMRFHSVMLKKIVAEIRRREDKDKIELVGTISAIDSHLAVYEAASLTNSEGKLDLSTPGYIRPRENKDAKDVLCFQLEDENWKHCLYFEYIKSDLGDVVINPTPYLDKVTGYDQTEDELSNMSFIFVKPTNTKTNDSKI